MPDCRWPTGPVTASVNGNSSRSSVITSGRRSIVMALGSAALFGASTPLAKLLIGGIDPWLLAGMLYLGSGMGLTLLLAWQRIV